MKNLYKQTITMLVLVFLTLWNYPVSADVLPALADYCVQSGGTVEIMPAEFTTANGLTIGHSKSFCTFTADNGFIVIGLETFASDKPSIAATYIKTLAEIDSTSSLLDGKATNPSYNVCKNLNGTMIGFVVNGSFTNASGASDICVFGDGSMVSAWSLIYMANHRSGYEEIKQQVQAEPIVITGY